MPYLIFPDPPLIAPAFGSDILSFGTDTALKPLCRIPCPSHPPTNSYHPPDDFTLSSTCSSNLLPNTTLFPGMVRMTSSTGTDVLTNSIPLQSIGTTTTDDANIDATNSTLGSGIHKGKTKKRRSKKEDNPLASNTGGSKLETRRSAHRAV